MVERDKIHCERDKLTFEHDKAHLESDKLAAEHDKLSPTQGSYFTFECLGYFCIW